MESLDRFIEAQQHTYPQVLAELRAGNKTGHWMWYVFPQIAGLGHSPMSVRYAIGSVEEAWFYTAHPVLGPRLLECTDAMLAWAGRKSAANILGNVDAQKFRSSMTLFEIAAGGVRMTKALDLFFGSERDYRTIELLAAIEA